MTVADRLSMTVGELSRRTGVPIKALRDYTDWGLIQSLGRSDANYRLYDGEALRCVQAISEMRCLGLTLAEIRWLANNYPDENGQLVGPRLAQRLQAARGRLERQREQIERTLDRIELFEGTYQRALAGQPGAEPWGNASDRAAC